MKAGLTGFPFESTGGGGGDEWAAGPVASRQPCPWALNGRMKWLHLFWVVCVLLGPKGAFLGREDGPTVFFPQLLKP